VHSAVITYLDRFATDDAIDVLDIGGRNVNGTPREMFPNARYTVLDIRDGGNVDIVADAARWEPDRRRWDLVVSTECFEHTEAWREICQTAYRACKPGGRIVVTCAGPGRAPHSAFVEAGLQPGEFYENVEPRELSNALQIAGFVDVEVDQVGLDLQATGRRMKL
jgi:SAM-dependent methyltransferase